jgi:hypothetical protein
MLSGAATTPGQAYVVVTPGAINQNGQVVVCPIGALTVSAMLTSLGLAGGSIVRTCNIPARTHGAFVGPGDSGLPIFDV